LTRIAVQTLRVQSSSSEQEDVQVEVTRLLVDCYFDIVRKNLQDAVPKAIMHFLVLFVQRGLQQRLIRCLYRSDATHPAKYNHMSEGMCRLK
jgi:dynamin 1-like protein